MPTIQTAQVSSYGFGAPATMADVLKFSVGRGGEIDLIFFNEDDDSDITVSAEVSADDSTYTATTAAANGAAVTNAVVKRRCDSNFTIVLRPGIDKFIRIRASGGARGSVQIRKGELAGLDSRLL